MGIDSLNSPKTDSLKFLTKSEFIVKRVKWRFYPLKLRNMYERKCTVAMVCTVVLINRNLGRLSCNLRVVHNTEKGP